MRKIIFWAILITGFQLFATENYAVVVGSSANLMNKEGFIVEKIRKGTVVKVKGHKTDKSAVEVKHLGKTYFGMERSFRVIESILDEEVNLLKKVSKMKEDIGVLSGLISEKSSEVSLKDEKIDRINRWLDVQKDMAFSLDYYKAKTKKVRKTLEKLERRKTLYRLELEALNKEKDQLQYELKEESEILKALQQKLKPLRAEKSLFDRGFMTVEVITKFAPVFHQGKIIKYLEKHSNLKVGVDHLSGDWYVVTQGQKKYYIASSDVKIKF